MDNKAFLSLANDLVDITEDLNAPTEHKESEELEPVEVNENHFAPGFDSAPEAEQEQEKLTLTVNPEKSAEMISGLFKMGHDLLFTWLVDRKYDKKLKRFGPDALERYQELLVKSVSEDLTEKEQQFLDKIGKIEDSRDSAQDEIEMSAEDLEDINEPLVSLCEYKNINMSPSTLVWVNVGMTLATSAMKLRTS